MTYFDKSKRQNHLFKNFVDLCHCAASALGISKGEFWVWYGNPFVLQQKLNK